LVIIVISLFKEITVFIYHFLPKLADLHKGALFNLYKSVFSIRKPIFYRISTIIHDIRNKV